MWPRKKDKDLDGKQVGHLKIFMRLLPFCIAEMKLIIDFVFVQ